MILTDREIQIALEKHQIIIVPEPSVDAYSSTSVDLRLDARLTEFADSFGGALQLTIDPSDKSYVAEDTLSRITSQIEIPPAGYALPPRKLVLGWTRERVELPAASRFAARVEGKSSLARLGLGVHITAPTIHSGFAYAIRLEIVNHGSVPILLKSGMRICQLVFELTMGTPQKGFTAMRSAPVPQPIR